MSSISESQLSCVFPSGGKYASAISSKMGGALGNACAWAAFLGNVGTESAGLTEWTQEPCNSATAAPYCGRGPLQITGESNYQYCASSSVCDCPDIVSEPSQASDDTTVGIGTAACVWESLSGSSLSRDADGSTTGLLKTACIINAGHYPCGTPNGWTSRQAYWAKANSCLGISSDAASNATRGGGAGFVEAGRAISPALFSPSPAPADECSLSIRTDCGYVGIDEPGCEAKGCCWQPSGEAHTADSPWCFYKASSKSSCFVWADAATSAPFSDAEQDRMRRYYLGNVGVQGTGAVVAAPDKNTPGGSYFYHWERDGALTMASLQVIGEASAAQLKAYAEWVEARQALSDPHGIDVRTEPKYEIPSGAVFAGAWCRPQNDGPGLRATALLIFAQSLLASGDADDASYLRSQLWAPDNNGTIQRSLAYLSSGDGWESATCDLWEEVRSTDFFWNRVTMKRALELGATFADGMGDETTAAACRARAAQLAPTIKAHFGASFLFEATNRQIDGAVIVALNHGFDDPRPVYAPADREVAATVLAYNAAFCAEYPINAADGKAGIPGVLYGRYPGDTYAGGNPWVLTSAALAQLLYRVGHAVASGAAPDADTAALWVKALNVDAGRDLDAKAFIGAGDAVLARLHAHVAADGGRLDEQIDKDSGKQASAHSLTWSYAEVFNALHWRGKATTVAAASSAAKQTRVEQAVA